MTFHLGCFPLLGRVFCGKRHEDIFERWTDFMNFSVTDSDAAQFFFNLRVRHAFIDQQVH